MKDTQFFNLKKQQTSNLFARILEVSWIPDCKGLSLYETTTDVNSDICEEVLAQSTWVSSPLSESSFPQPWCSTRRLQKSPNSFPHIFSLISINYICWPVNNILLFGITCGDAWDLSPAHWSVIALSRAQGTRWYGRLNPGFLHAKQSVKLSLQIKLDIYFNVSFIWMKNLGMSESIVGLHDY